MKQIGLDSKEIAIYLATLEIGETPIMPIAKKVKLPRSTVFHILERLRDERLIEIIQGEHRRIYTPITPRKILTLMKNKRENLTENIDSFESILPKLTQMYSKRTFEPKIRFFHGQNELREIYEDVLESGTDEGVYVGDTDKIIETLGKEYAEDWMKRRVAKGIRSHSIRVRPDETQAKWLEQTRKEYLRTIRWAPEDFKSPTHVMVYRDKVSIMTTGAENFGVLITSREFAETMQNWFKQLWKISSPVD